MATVKGTHRGAVDQAKSFIAAMRHQCYCLSEYRICRDVANPNFIRAFEGGRNDCGILVNDTVLTGTLTHKFFQVLRSEGADILPIEIKTLSPCADSRGNIVWSFVFSEQQLQNAQAVIIASLFDPEFVALLPMHYVLKRKDLEPKQGVQESYRPQWSIHPVSAFPVEFSPFIVPIAQLGSALESMRRVNQYTGTTYAEVPPLVPATVEQLLPDFPPWAKALKDLQLLHEAFEEKSEKFIVEMLDIFPLFGDFKIISRDQPDVQIIGECKSNHCEFEFQGRNRVMSHDQLAKGFVGRKIFCWNTQLDVLVTRHSRHPNQALFLPRDMIPHYWWNKDPPDGKLYWPNTDEDMAILKTYVVDLSSKTRIVADIERILLMLQAQRSSMRAQNPVPMKPYEFEHLHEILNYDGRPQVAKDAEGEDEIREDGGRWGPRQWSSSSYHRGFGSSEHEDLRGNTYEFWAGEALIEICRRRGRGRLVNMGKRNPHGRFVVVNYRWSRRDKKRYDDDGQPPRSYTVHPDIPVLPVSFLSLVWTYEKYPIGTRAAEFAANHRFQTRWPSIIVCDVFPIRCIRQRHARFILPWEIVHKEASAVEHHGKFHLDEGILDNYHTSEDELIQVILSALTGTLTTSLGTRVEGCEYAVYLKDIMAGGVLGYSSIKDEDTQFEEGYS